MKTFLSPVTTIIYLVIISMTGLQGTAQNLIINGGFEDHYNQWETWTKNGYNAQFQIDTTDTHNGSGAAVINVTENASDYWAFRFFNVQFRQDGFEVSDADVLTLSFWGKTDNLDRKMIQAGIAKETIDTNDCTSTGDCFWNLDDYDFCNFTMDTTWKQYQIQFLAPAHTNDIQLEFRFGEKTGQYYVDDIKLEVTHNIAEQNDWLANAQSRIDTLRKNNFTVKVEGKNGSPLQNADITAEHIRHNFQWGTAMRMYDTWEKSHVLKTFNTAVNEMAFKWPQMEPSRGDVYYSTVNSWVNWALDHRIQVRGHNLVWPKQGEYLPTWFEELSKNEAVKALKTRMKREVNYYEDTMTGYDVINEPVHNPFLGDWLGTSIYDSCFIWADEADPDARLYINEWWNFDKWDNRRYKKWIEQRLANGTPLDGIGMQAHLDNERVDWRQYKFKMDYLAETGLDMKITEFDMHKDRIGMTEIERARDYAKMMKLAFSYPPMKGFLIWGLIDGWRNNAAIYNDDYTPRPAADTMHHYIKELWSTYTSGQSKNNGEYQFNGYYGDYKITVSAGGTTKTFYRNFANDSLKTTVTMPIIDNRSSPTTQAPIDIYPIPCSRKLHIKTGQTPNQAPTHMTLSDLQGRKLITRTWHASTPVSCHTIDVSDLAPNTYVLHIKQGDEQYNHIVPIVP